MPLWVVVLIYMAGVALIVLEALLPGMILGFIGMAGVVLSIIYGFEHDWLIGTAQVVITLVVIPVAFYMAFKRLSVKASISAESGGVSFGKDYQKYLGLEGEAIMDLHPSGMVLIDGKKVDVVTAGESIEKGRRVRVVKVEGNRVIVRAL